MKATTAWSKAVASALGMVVGSASLLLVYAASANLQLDALAYIVADNMLIAAAVLSLVLVLIQIGEPTAESAACGGAVMAVAATGAALSTVTATIVHYRGLPVYDVMVALLAGLGVALLPFALAATALLTFSQPLSRRGILRMYLLLALIMTCAVLLRSLAPGSGVLTWAVAPLCVFMVPGMSLAAALLPTSAGWMERLICAPPLSLGAQIISLLWLNWLGIRATVPVFFLISGVFTLLGLWGVLHRRAALPG